MSDPFGAKTTLVVDGRSYVLFRPDAVGDLSTMPTSIKVLLECALRNLDGRLVTEAHVRALAAYDARSVGEVEIPFLPGRVVLQDFTGVPAVVDLAAMRAAVARLGGDVQRVNPLIRADLVIDHSVQVDAFGSDQAIVENTRLEFERNRERYEFLKWGQKALSNFSVVPPETGIVHQVNLEHLAPVALTAKMGDDDVVYPDSVVGTDSHTTMINGAGVVGWGVGGIEAEACMLGQPISMLIPEVVGFEIVGRIPEGVTATDVVLVVTQMLRKHGVVNKFVEFTGDGLDDLPLADRATIANMAPEYGATIGFFPIDEATLTYLRLTGRDPHQVRLVEASAKAMGLWRDPARKPVFSSTLRLDLSTVVPCLAGPKRPQDRVALTDMQTVWRRELAASFGHATPAKPAPVAGTNYAIRDGAVVIAAITSCTNTSNPSVLVAAGLLARNAVARGLTSAPWVKTSLAPGSRVVTDYLDAAGLTAPLEALGFHTVGYGCTTCIGNSGPLPEAIGAAISEGQIVAAAVLSGNRNFEGRVNPHCQANWLASPPLCVAYAIAGTVDWDPATEPIGTDREGRPVFLKDLWPSHAEVSETLARVLSRDRYTARYADVFAGGESWRALPAPTGATFAFDPASTYIQEPPYFLGLTREVRPISPIRGARVLAKVGHSITTDHISPAGNIALKSPAGQYLLTLGVQQADFNSYGARRGNDRVMTRGTFANIRLRNELAPGTEGWMTTYLGPAADVDGTVPGLPYDSLVSPAPGEVCALYDASVKYQKHRIPLVVLAGKDYGMGSSRDWAAKGTWLLGVRAVIAESYERIHRSNLVGMGVLPLEFVDGSTAASLGLTGHEIIDLPIDDDVVPLQRLTVTATAADGTVHTFPVRVRIDTPVEVTYYRNGGVLHTVLRRLVEE